MKFFADARKRRENTARIYDSAEDAQQQARWAR